MIYIDIENILIHLKLLFNFYLSLKKITSLTSLKKKSISLKKFKVVVKYNIQIISFEACFVQFECLERFRIRRRLSGEIGREWCSSSAVRRVLEHRLSRSPCKRDETETPCSWRTFPDSSWMRLLFDACRSCRSRFYLRTLF